MSSSVIQRQAQLTPDSFTKELINLLERELPTRELSRLGTPEDVARKIIAALPDAGAAWSSAVGPVYTSHGLQSWLGVSRQAISQKAKANHYLRLQTTDGVYVFPSFQFNENGQGLPHLSDILSELAKGANDTWMWATWLNTPDDNGETNADKLRGGNWEYVRDLARDDATAWSD